MSTGFVNSPLNNPQHVSTAANKCMDDNLDDKVKLSCSNKVIRMGIAFCVCSHFAHLSFFINHKFALKIGELFEDEVMGGLNSVNAYDLLHLIPPLIDFTLSITEESGSNFYFHQ